MPYVMLVQEQNYTFTGILEKKYFYFIPTLRKIFVDIPELNFIRYSIISNCCHLATTVYLLYRFETTSSTIITTTASSRSTIQNLCLSRNFPAQRSRNQFPIRSLVCCKVAACHFYNSSILVLVTSAIFSENIPKFAILICVFRFGRGHLGVEIWPKCFFTRDTHRACACAG